MNDRVLMPVFAWMHFELLPPDRWFVEAQAFIDTAEMLFQSMTGDRFERSWPRAKVAAFVFGHSIELFFKACIGQARREIPHHHRLHDLYTIYKELYPGPDFRFDSLVEDFIDASKSRPFFLFLKYPEDETDITKRMDADVSIDVAEWQSQASQFREDIERIWPKAKQRYP
jgi:hypothetical protein